MRFPKVVSSLSLFLALSMAPAAARADFAQPPPVAAAKDKDPAAARRAEARAFLGKRRRENIARLEAYAQAGKFPRNRVSKQVINVFRDEAGKLCAVANLIWLSGDHDLVEQTAQSNDYVKFADVKDGPLLAWVLGSGFTKEEIAAIQLPDSPVMNEPNWEPNENQKMKDHIARVKKDLDRNFERSLTIAVDRYLAANEARPAPQARPATASRPARGSQGSVRDFAEQRD